VLDGGSAIPDLGRAADDGIFLSANAGKALRAGWQQVRALAQELTSPLVRTEGRAEKEAATFSCPSRER